MKNIYIVETTYGIQAWIEERKQAQMIHDAVEHYLMTKAKERSFNNDPDNHILQDFANELDWLLKVGYPVFVDDKE